MYAHIYRAPKRGITCKSNGRRKPATIGELTMHAHVYKGKNRMKPSLVDLIGAIIGFAGLAVFVFLCLAY